MKKLFLFVLALSVCVQAAEGSLEERVGVLQAQVDRAMSKAGIHFSGEFRSQFLNSSLSGSEGVVSDTRKKSESAEYTSVDFDIVARPNTAFSARAMFRLHQDWRNFFSDVQNPITTRWISVDGTLGQGMFKYSLGDYKKKLTPLTIWSPDIELLYEPEIFASARRLAMSEAFLGENNRVLMGIDLSFQAELYSPLNDVAVLNEINADVFGARLASSGNQETGILPLDVETPQFDKYLVGASVGTDFLSGGMSVGVSDILIFDYLESSSLDSIRAKLASQSTNVVSGRVGFDNRAFMDDGFVRFGIKAEVAYSLDKDYYPKYALDDDGIPTTTLIGALDSTVNGLALNGGLFVRLALGEADEINLQAGFINNEDNFRNDAAQTPTFFYRDIMNSEQGLGGKGFANPFDAMYRTVFKYAPSQYFGGTNPQTKNAYNSAIVSKPVGGYERVEDFTVFQSALPGGLASSNRTGPVGNLKGSFLDKAITVGVKAASLNNVSDLLLYQGVDVDGEGNTIYSLVPLAEAKFLEAGGGLSVDIAKFAPAVGPSLVIGGSGTVYNADYVGVSSTESVLLSGELNYNFYQRFSLMGGYQQLVTNVKAGGVDTGTLTFDNFGVGLGYKVADGGSLVVKLTMLSGKLEPAGGEAVDYKAMQPEVYLTVKF